MTFGAPIVRDRVALFVNAGMQRSVTPQAVPAPSRDTASGADSAGVGIRYESLVRFGLLCLSPAESFERSSVEAFYEPFDGARGIYRRIGA